MKQTEAQTAVSSARRRVGSLTLCALMAAFLCILSPWAIPVGAIPISLSLFAVLLSGVLLGPWRGGAAVLVYLLVGSIGLPVFGGGAGGFSVLIGPTGGYLCAYPIAACLGGILWRLAPRNGRFAFWAFLASLLPSVAVCHLLGVLWLSYVSQMPVKAAFLAGTLPFLPFDLIKCIAVALLAPILKKRIRI